jgi:DNA-binding SARP family transcriptional activator
MDFRILGPIEVREAGRALPLGGVKQRALLALLLINANQVVSIDWLTDQLWGDDPPDTARNVVQVYVSQLRKILGAKSTPDEGTRLATRTPGYLLELDPDSLDVARLQRLGELGHGALVEGRAADAVRLLDDALSQFRGDPLWDFADEPFAEPEIQRLQERRLAIQEDLHDARLACGASATLIPELERLAAEHPYRERLRGQLMLALYRSGRQADALAAYRVAAEVLADELGIDPGPELRSLHEAMLRQDQSLLTPPSVVAAEDPEVAQLLEPTAGERVMVTALAAERADCRPEQWADAVQLVDAAGGAVLTFDAGKVAALFGFPRIVEDHAERAALTALALAERGAALGLATAKAPTATLAGAGPESEVVAAAAELATASGLVQLDPVAAYRLNTQFDIAERGNVLVMSATQRRPVDVPNTPLVGRDRELLRLDRLATDLRAGRGQVLLVEGETGLGKTRMLSELHTLLAGKVWWLPVSASSRDRLAPQPALVRALSRVIDEKAWPDVAGSQATAEQLHRLLEAGAEQPNDPSAIVDVIEQLASDAPVVIALDDVEAVDATTSRIVEALLPLTDRRPICLALTLGGGEPVEPAGLVAKVSTQLRHRLTQLELEPLAHDEAEQLVDALSPTGAVAPASRADVVTRSGGNPLFLEQLVQSLVEGGGLQRSNGWTLAMTRVGALLPPMLEDVLAVRMQKLSPDARRLAQAAAVLGDGARISDLQAVAEVDQPEAPMAELMRSQVLVEGGRFPELSFRFHHHLLQEAALSTLTPARARAFYARAADALEASSDFDLERLAFLRYRAHQWEPASQLLEAAADNWAPVDNERADSLRALATRARDRLN